MGSVLRDTQRTNFILSLHEEMYLPLFVRKLEIIHPRATTKMEEFYMCVISYKLIHGIIIPLVADKVAVGRSTMHGILCPTCLAICNNLGPPDNEFCTIH